MATKQWCGITRGLFLDFLVATKNMEKKTGEEVGHQGKGLCASALVDVPGVGWAAL